MAPGVTTVYVFVSVERYGAVGRHVFAYSVALAIELFVDLDPGGPQHRRSLLREDGGARPELLPSGRRQRPCGRSPLGRRRCACHLRRRHGPEHQSAGGPGIRRPSGLTAAAAIAKDDILIPSWQQLIGRDHLGQQGLHDLSERPGRLGKLELHLLRLRRPNRLHGQRIRRNQFCRAHVGRLSGSGQSTGRRHGSPRPALSIRPFIRSVWDQATTPISTTSPAAATAFPHYRLRPGHRLGKPNGSGLINALTGNCRRLLASPFLPRPLQSPWCRVAVALRRSLPAVSGGFDSAVALTASWPAHQASLWASVPTSIAAPGSGTSTHDHDSGLDHRDRHVHRSPYPAPAAGITHTTTVSLTVTAAVVRQLHLVRLTD